MDGFTNPKIEKQSIYEIYRACRLCGAGAGYKMPIIQNVVDLDSGEVELKHKVRECVQIEVHQDDKMPPLICELCVDKVNDFYEFLEMCRQTNKQTRLRLGLPPQTLPRGAPDAGDCILGVTEPIFIDEDSNEPIQRPKGKTPVKSVKTKELESRDTKTKLMPKKDFEKEKEETRSGKHEPRTLRRRFPSPPPRSPPRVLRGTKRSNEDDLSLSRLQKTRKSDEPMPKSILKRERDSKSEERMKITRLREKEIENKANSQKVVKIMVKKENFSESLKSSPRVRTLSPKPREKTPPPTVHKCKQCKAEFKDGRALNNHMRSHAKQNELPKTPPPNVYKCKICKAELKDGRSLSNHMRSHAKPKPVERDPTPPPKKEVKKPECRDCGKQFLSRNMLDIHHCSRRTVKSTKLVTEEKPEKPQRTVSKPQRVSSLKKRPEAPIDPELLKQCRPLLVKISKCDPLLENKLGDHYDVSDVDYDYGLDRTCVYPYIYTFRHLRIKSEPLYMVNIQDEIKNVLDRDENYVHWDSDETDSDLELSDTKKVDTLTSLSLKTLFSQKLLGKVPKKRRKVKVEKAFDSMLNSTNDFDSDMRLGIDNIINSLADDNDKSSKNDDNDSLFGDDNSPAIAVTNDDFDSLFSSDAPKSNDKNIIDTKSEDSNITNFSMDFTEGISDKDKSKLSNYSSTVQDSKIESKQLNTNNSLNDDNDSKYDGDDMNSNDKNDSKDDISKSDAGNNTSTDDKENNDANSVSNDDNNVKDNQVAITENDSSRTEVNDNSVAENDTEADVNPENKDREPKNDGNHVNGQTDLGAEFNMDDLEDVSDSEMEETSLMEALDTQIDGKETAIAKTSVSESDKTVAEDVIAPSAKCTDLESISDGEFE